jgi:hypothetical protein
VEGQAGDVEPSTEAVSVFGFADTNLGERALLLFPG